MLKLLLWMNKGIEEVLTILNPSQHVFTESSLFLYTQFIVHFDSTLWNKNLPSRADAPLPNVFIK